MEVGNAKMIIVVLLSLSPSSSVFEVEEGEQREGRGYSLSLLLPRFHLLVEKCPSKERDEIRQALQLCFAALPGELEKKGAQKESAASFSLSFFSRLRSGRRKRRPLFFCFHGFTSLVLKRAR